MSEEVALGQGSSRRVGGVAWRGLVREGPTELKVPLKHSQLPGTCEGDLVWKEGLRWNQVKMGFHWSRVSPNPTWCPYKKRDIWTQRP